MQQSHDYYKENMKEPLIETVGGNPFYINRPVFHVTDIAGALSKLCRFNGHSSRFYSVAQHSLLVAEIMEYVTGGDPFEGLMHDATEAYLADIPSPFKALLPEYKTLENKLDSALREWAHLPPKISNECKTADYMALHVEAHSMVHSKGNGEGWVVPKEIKDAANTYIDETDPPKSFWLKDPYDIEQHWLAKYLVLAGDRFRVTKHS